MFAGGRPSRRSFFQARRKTRCVALFFVTFRVLSQRDFCEEFQKCFNRKSDDVA